MTQRFDCLYREYKYFFLKRDLNIERMREAAGYLVGTHNFKNFCKIDRAKKVINYVREIMRFEITRTASVTGSEEPALQVYEFCLRGTAFLWHQVRFMVSVLFLVGQGLEEPSIVKDLLDPKRYPRRPVYSMAPETPLVLNDCAFEDLFYDHNQDIHERNIAQFLDVLQEQAVRTASVMTIIDQVRNVMVPRPASLPKTAFDGDEFIAFRRLHPEIPSNAPKKHIKIANLAVVGYGGAPEQVNLTDSAGDHGDDDADDDDFDGDE